MSAYNQAVQVMLFLQSLIILILLLEKFYILIPSLKTGSIVLCQNLLTISILRVSQVFIMVQQKKICMSRGYLAVTRVHAFWALILMKFQVPEVLILQSRQAFGTQNPMSLKLLISKRKVLTSG